MQPITRQPATGKAEKPATAPAASVPNKGQNERSEQVFRTDFWASILKNAINFFLILIFTPKKFFVHFLQDHQDKSKSCGTRFFQEKSLIELKPN